MEKQVFIDKLARGLTEMEIDHNHDKLEKLWEYKELLLTENKKYNLTSITEPEKILKKHFLDSVCLLSELDFNKNDNIIDVGTGAGFPGMVLKIFLLDNEITLLDSTLKKITFLQILSAKLGIFEKLDAVHARAEDLADKKDYRESFSHVVSRAVAPLNILLEYTAPFAQKEGYINCLKGPNYTKEIKEAKEAMEILGVCKENIRKVNIPNLKAERYLVTFKKVSSTPEKYPRRAGIPKKRPL